MSGPAPVNDYASLIELSGRIHQYLTTHPRDPQALGDLHYVVGLLQGGATQAANVQDSPAPASTQPGAEITAGLTQSALDIPKGILTAVTHPLRTAGQLTGVGNWGGIKTAFQDPEANWAERVDAIVRGTPLNMGYAAERGLLNATGAKSDEPASLTDQAHAAGNVASLALLGVNKRTPGVALAGRVLGKIPVLGPLSRAAGDVMQRYKMGTAAAPIEEILPNGMRASVVRAQLTQVGGTPVQVEAAIAHLKGESSGGLLRPASAPPAVLEPMPGHPRGLLGPEGMSPPAKSSYPPSLAEMQGMNTEPLRPRPGHPVYYREPAPTGSPEVRGGEPLLPTANPTIGPVMAKLRALPTAQLVEAFKNAPKELRDLLIVEFQRRRITIPDLGIRPGLLGG